MRRQLHQHSTGRGRGGMAISPSHTPHLSAQRLVGMLAFSRHGGADAKRQALGCLGSHRSRRVTFE